MEMEEEEAYSFYHIYTHTMADITEAVSPFCGWWWQLSCEISECTRTDGEAHVQSHLCVGRRW